MDDCTEYPKSVESLPDMYPWRDGISTTGSSTHEHQERSTCVEFFFPSWYPPDSLQSYQLALHVLQRYAQPLHNSTQALLNNEISHGSGFSIQEITTMHYKVCLHPRYIIKKVEQVTQLQVRISHLMLYSIPLRQNKPQQKVSVVATFKPLKSNNVSPFCYQVWRFPSNNYVIRQDTVLQCESTTGWQTIGAVALWLKAARTSRKVKLNAWAPP